MKRCVHCAARPFVTEFWVKRQRCVYRTLSPSLGHGRIRREQSAVTYRYDYTVKDWPFGVYAEVVASSFRLNPRNEKRKSTR